MSDQFSEIEVKYDAKNVDVEKFLDWCMSHRPARYERVEGPDVYYEQGDNVVRHRHHAGPDRCGEVTVKKRKGSRSIMDRLEINLRFEAGTGVTAVDAFLQATGWTKAFKLCKDAHIFWFKKGQEHATLVVYSVGKETIENGEIKLVECRRFVEIEIEASSGLESRAAKDALRRWRKQLLEAFPDLGDPLNDSLYEIYSGKRYQLVEKSA